jgi:hypothetical protein
MRLRATIVIDIDAADFVEAADHQRSIETFLGDLKRNYQNAALDFRESRTSRRGRQKPPSRMPAPTGFQVGRVRPYVD